MTAIFNRKLIELSTLSFSEIERPFAYGDGLFETIIIKNGKIKFLEYHWERLSQGMKALSLMGDGITPEHIERDIKVLVEKKKCGENARIKVQVWRQSGGLYTPDNNLANILILASQLSNRPEIINKSGIANSIHLNYSPLSALKTCNSLPYVLAGLEKTEKNWDEIIILDNNGNLSECSSSNLFWLKDNIIFTPSLFSGCIAGVMRRHILEQASLSKRQHFEVLEKSAVLSTADQVFCCNITGVYLFRNFGTQYYNTELDSDINNWVRI